MSEYEKVRDRWIEREGHTPQCRICGGYAREPELCRCSVEGAILLDLIAELRAEHYPHPCTDPEDFPCEHRQRVAVAQLWARNVRTTEILLGLIAELRAYARYTYTEYTLIENALDRAETRLMSLNKGHKDTEVTSDE